MPFQTNDYLAKSFYFFLIGLAFFFPRHGQANSWQNLGPGIEYQKLLADILTPWAQVHVFRIDLKKNQLKLITAKSLNLKNASAEFFAKQSDALISINGGFFDKDFKPLGLRINQQQQENPLKPISWWGIFYIKNQEAHITNPKQFDPDNTELALQSGPRLLVNKRILKLKAGKDNRSALGITAKGKLILVVSTNAPMTTKELAHLMRAPPLSCVNAINLDGGSSSQLYAHINDFRLNVLGFSNVSDALVIKARA